MSDTRWPASVYADGEEPDYRWSYANERTFLAWIRTALALVAAGVALDAVPLSLPHVPRVAVAVTLLVLGLACALVAWPRWAAAERAMRRREPLPGPGFTLPLAVLVGMATAVLLVVVVRVAS